MDIEQLAINAITESISITSNLSGFINVKDKEPIWDGEIYVYTDVSKKNSVMAGRVSVQIKGLTNNNLSNETITYRINANNLELFLSEGGVVYFVVYINETGQKRIYYANLLPFNIKQLLKSAKTENKKSIPVKMITFPTDNDEKEIIFLNHIRDRKLQSSIINMDIDDINSIIKDGKIKEFSFSYNYKRSNQRPNTIEYLKNHNVYLYAKTENGIDIPIGTNIQIGSIIKKKAVSCNGKAYYNSITINYKKDSVQYLVGKSIDILYNIESRKYIINITTKGTLSERITDGSFYVDIIKYGGFKIGDNQDGIEISFDCEKSKQIEIGNVERDVDHLKQIQDALSKVGVKDDLNCDLLTEKDWGNLDMLIDAFVNQKPVSLILEYDNNLLNILTIANIAILLHVQKTENELYRIYNFFSYPLNIDAIDKENDDIKFPISQYIFLNQEHFMKLSNNDYDSIYNGIISIKQCDDYLSLVNQLQLNMLIAYDNSQRVDKKEQLECSLKISSWLIENNKNVENNLIFYINYCQIHKRMKGISKEDLIKLHTLLENGSLPEEIFTAIYILLDNSIGAEIHYELLSPEQQERFNTYPICKFWNRNNNATENDIMIIHQ